MFLDEKTALGTGPGMIRAVTFRFRFILFWFFSPLKFSPQDNKIDEKNGKNKLLLKSYFVDYATQCTPLHCELLYITRRATNLI